MSKVTYEIVQHDGGWAYKVNGVFSEPFSTHAEALAAARAAAEDPVSVDGRSTRLRSLPRQQWHCRETRSFLPSLNRGRARASDALPRKRVRIALKPLRLQPALRLHFIHDVVLARVIHHF